jgi:Transposase
MDVMVSKCAGIDIGKAEVVVCLRVPGSRGQRVSEVRTFSTVAGQINRLADWLAEQQVSHVVMEATGQYWKPVWDVLAERGFELMLVNARHVTMPKSDHSSRLSDPTASGGCLAGTTRLPGPVLIGSGQPVLGGVFQ